LIEKTIAPLLGINPKKFNDALLRPEMVIGRGEKIRKE